MEMDTDMNAEIEIDFGIDMYMDGGRGFHYKNLKSSHLWRAAYTPGERSNQSGVPYQPCTVPVYILLCNC
jgi:hypothetical protein